jgi:hypothetical protein
MCSSFDSWYQLFLLPYKVSSQPDKSMKFLEPFRYWGVFQHVVHTLPLSGTPFLITYLTHSYKFCDSNAEASLAGSHPGTLMLTFPLLFFHTFCALIIYNTAFQLLNEPFAFLTHMWNPLSSSLQHSHLYPKYRAENLASSRQTANIHGINDITKIPDNMHICAMIVGYIEVDVNSWRKEINLLKSFFYYYAAQTNFICLLYLSYCA